MILMVWLAVAPAAVPSFAALPYVLITSPLPRRGSQRLAVSLALLRDMLGLTGKCASSVL